MASAAEVLVKLVVDSNAPKATADLKHGLEKAESTHKHFAKGLLDGKANLASLGTVGKAAFGLVSGAVLGAGAALLGTAIGATHAFLESEEQVRALAGTLTLLDTSGTGFEEMTEISRDLKDGLEDVAMQVGATDDALMAAFADVIERGGKSIDQATELTEAMANAGRAVPGGIGTLSGAFEMIEMGAVRAKNPIVGMIAATHMLRGNAKQVAKQMQAMSPEKQMALAEKAIAAMSKKMKDVPLSIQEMSTSMKVFVGNLFEDAGQPIVENLLPLFTTIRKFAFDNAGVFKSVGKEFGGAVGKVVEVALPVSKEIFRALKESSGEIKRAMDAFAGPGKEFFKYIYENKDTFAKTMGDVFKDMITAVRALSEVMSAMGGILTVVGDAAKVAARLTPEGKKFMAEEALGASTKAIGASVRKPFGRADLEANAKMEEEYKANFIAAHEGMADVQRAALDSYDAAVRRAEQSHADAMSKVQKYRQGALYADTDSFVAAWKIAAAGGDEGAQEYVASWLASSNTLKQAIGEKGPQLLGEGFSKLLETLGGAGLGQTKLLGDVTAAGKAASKAAVGVGKGPQVNQYIGTVNVKQDFKDIDPERVAIVFRNDLAKHGVARLQPLGAKAGGF